MFFAVYLVAVNLIEYFLMAYDKQCAIDKRRRIPEKVLFEVALAGGALGGILAMRTCRHKTRHIQFKYGLPIILVLQVLAWLWVVIFR